MSSAPKPPHLHRDTPAGPHFVLLDPRHLRVISQKYSSPVSSSGTCPSLALHTRSVSCFRPFPSPFPFDSSITKNRNGSQWAQSVYSQRYQYLLNDNPPVLTLPSPGNLSASSTLAPSAHLMPTRSGIHRHPAFLPNHRSRCCPTIQVR